MVQGGRCHTYLILLAEDSLLAIIADYDSNNHGAIFSRIRLQENYGHNYASPFGHRHPRYAVYSLRQDFLFYTHVHSV